MRRAKVVLALATVYLVACASADVPNGPAASGLPGWWNEHVRFVTKDGGT